MAGQIQTLQEMINQVVKGKQKVVEKDDDYICLLYTSPSPRD